MKTFRSYSNRSKQVNADHIFDCLIIYIYIYIYITFDTKRNQIEKISNRNLEPFYFSIKIFLIIYFSYFQLKKELLLDQFAKKACSKKLRWSNQGTKSHKTLIR